MKASKETNKDESNSDNLLLLSVVRKKDKNNDPEIKEISGKPYVTYGPLNDFFEYLIDRREGSPTNGAVLNSIIDLIYGKGLVIDAQIEDIKSTEVLNNLLKPEDIQKCADDLKALGQCALQIQYNGDHELILATKHLPVETLAAEKLDKNQKINAYYHANDWTKVKNVNDTQRIPIFGSSDEGLEILYIKPYSSNPYYNRVDYNGGLKYAEVEEEIGIYHVNNILNGFSPTTLINFNNGVPIEEERKKIKKDVVSKYTGPSSAGKIVIAFNKDKEHAATIDTLDISNADRQYQFLSSESIKKILISHRVTSPLLFGIHGATGFGSNADELIVASQLFENLVIEPFRQLLITGFDKILKFNKLDFDIEFESLNLIIPTSTKNNNARLKKKVELARIEIDSKIVDQLIAAGEDETDDWILIFWDEIDEELEDHRNTSIELTSTGTAIPNAKSEKDVTNIKGDQVKVRYQYFPLSLSSNSREFCRKMVNAKKIYRKEDVIRMGDQAVNEGFGPHGADTYSIWKYKGGVECSHRWTRKTFIKKEAAAGIDIKSPLVPTISQSQARRQGFRIGVDDPLIYIKPKDMPRGGRLPK